MTNPFARYRLCDHSLYLYYSATGIKKPYEITRLSKVRKILDLVVRLAENPHLESLVQATV